MKRAIFVSGDVAFIPLTKGFVAVIDSADLHLVDGVNWSASEDKCTTYAMRKVGREKLTLHRVVMGAAPGVQIDHRDGDGLNCRRSNLRVATCAQNNLNRRRRSDNKTGLKGVWRHRQCGRFQAAISIAGVRKHLGLFTTAEEAHEAYRAASAELHGEFGRTE